MYLSFGDIRAPLRIIIAFGIHWWLTQFINYYCSRSSFRFLASKSFPGGYSKSVCVCMRVSGFTPKL